MKQTVITIVISFIIFFIVGYIYMLSIERSQQEEEIQKQFQEEEAQLENSVWDKQDYPEALREAQALVEEYTVANESLDRAALNREFQAKMGYITALTGRGLVEDQEDIYNLYWDLITDVRFERYQRDSALINVLWHTTSHAGDDLLSIEDIKQYFLNEERLFSLQNVNTGEFIYNGEGFTNLANPAREDVRRAAWHYLKYLADYGFLSADEETLAYAMTARYHYAAYADSDIPLEEKYAEMKEYAQTAHERIQNLKKEASSDSSDGFLSITMFSLYNVQYAYLYYALGYGVTEDIALTQELHQELRDMHSAFSQFSDAYILDVFAVISGLVQACTEVAVAPNTASLQDVEVPLYLGPLYELSDTNLDRRRGIREMANGDHFCSEPIVTMVNNNLDSRLKNVLVNKIGGWEDSDFNN